MMTTSLLLKASLILLTALLASAGLKEGRASVRHLFLALAFAALLAMPTAAALLPRVVIELPARHPIHETVTTGLEALTAGVVAQSSNQSEDRHDRAWPTHTDELMLGWLLGSIVTFMPVLSGLWQIHRIRSSARSWLQGQAVANALAESLKIRRPVSVRLHRAVGSPLTFGLSHPMVVFPADADRWCRSAIEQVLRHELEHVRRGDWMTQSIARAVCAFYWLHPLVWIAWRRLRIEAERACDDVESPDGG